MWYVAVPVWGEQYLDIFARAGLPSLLAALDRVQTPRRLVIYTLRDFLPQVQERLKDVTYEYVLIDNLLSITNTTKWDQMLTASHNHAMAHAPLGTYLSLMVADMVISPETYAAAEARFAQGFKVLALSTIRANDGVPDASSAEALLRWGWENRHALADGCIMPGATVLNWATLYFPGDDGGVTARTRYLHPVAIRLTKRIVFWGTTIDAGLLNRFGKDEVYVVTSPYEASTIDLSPIDRPVDFKTAPSAPGMKHMQDDWPFKTHCVTIIPPRPPDWLIAVPCWGGRYRQLFLECGLPAMKKALERVNGNHRFVIHTDDPDTMCGHFKGWNVEFYPVPDQHGHIAMGAANKQALQMARKGEAIAFINADMTPSVEVFEAAERRFREGKRVILCAGTRTTGGTPPVGVTARSMLEWAWAHRHPWITGTTWGSGKCPVTSVLHFTDGQNVVMHAFHLQPAAVLKDRELTFKKQTVDDDLTECYDLSEIHIVTSADEMGFAEVSLPDDPRFLPKNEIISIQTVINWARACASPRHYHFFTKRICLVGEDKELGDTDVVMEVLGRLTSRQQH